MSVSAASSLFHAATAILTSPAAQLSGFSLATTAPAASAKPPAQHLHDRTQSGLLQLQQDAQSGALANGLDQIIGGAA